MRPQHPLGAKPGPPLCACLSLRGCADLTLNRRRSPPTALEAGGPGHRGEGRLVSGDTCLRGLQTAASSRSPLLHVCLETETGLFCVSSSSHEDADLIRPGPHAADLTEPELPPNGSPPSPPDTVGGYGFNIRLGVGGHGSVANDPFSGSLRQQPRPTAHLRSQYPLDPRLLSCPGAAETSGCSSLDNAGHSCSASLSCGGGHAEPRVPPPAPRWA